MTSRRARLGALSLAVVAAACSGSQTATTTAPPTTTTAPPTTTLPTVTTSAPQTTAVPANPWATLLGEANAPRGWTVAPCSGDGPFLCIDHDGITARVRLERMPVAGSAFAGFLAEAGAPPETTDLGSASAYPAILRALRAQVAADFTEYTAVMASAFPDGVPVLEAPVIAPMGGVTGIRYGYRIEGPDGSLLAYAVRHLAFDGESLWLVDAQFDPVSGDAGFTDLGTLLDMDPHLTLIVKNLAVGPALPGTEVTTVELPPVGDVTSAWRQRFVIPYGAGAEELGTSPGGDAGSLLLGPEFGTQAPDGTWWMLDGSKKRLAHYTADGGYLGQVALGSRYLVNGQLFQWQLPHALADGTVVASRLGPADTTLLMFTNGALSVKTIPVAVTPKIDDGEALYGLARDGSIRRIDRSGGVDTVDWFRTLAGTRFQLWVSGATVTVWMPDAPPPNIHRFHFVYGPDPADGVFVGLEAAGAADGSIYLYLLGGTDSGAGGQLGGILVISAEGAVAPLEPTRGPQIRSDSGSPAHLGSNPASGLPWLMFVDEDGVRVFERS